MINSLVKQIFVLSRESNDGWVDETLLKNSHEGGELPEIWSLLEFIEYKFEQGNIPGRFPPGKVRLTPRGRELASK